MGKVECGWCVMGCGCCCDGDMVDVVDGGMGSSSSSIVIMIITIMITTITIILKSTIKPLLHIPNSIGRSDGYQGQIAWWWCVVVVVGESEQNVICKR